MRPADLLVLGIDQGTSATKTIAVDAAGRIVARASAPLEQSTPRPGWVEQSPEEIWQSVVVSVADCLGRVGDPRAVAAAGISNQRESMLLWDRATGAPVSPLISWQDQRGADLCRRLAAAGAGEEVLRRSGLPLDPMFSAARAAWLLDTYDPERRRAAAGELALGTVDAWLLHRLGAGHVTEAGNASRTQLLDIRELSWSPPLLELFGVPAEVLPEVAASDAAHPATAALPPLPAGTPVTAILGDSHAALFAHAGWVRGRVKATYGTGSSLMCLTETGGGVPDSGACLTVAWQAGEEPAHALEGNIRATGATLAWLARLLRTTPEQLGETAATDSGGVAVVPAFNGLGAPWWDDRAVGLISGLTLATGPAELARAVLESTAFQVADVLDAFARSGVAAEVLLADGGASASPRLMQLQADLAGVPVHAAQAPELSALGAAHLAGLATGVWTQEELEALPRGYRVYEPRMDADRRKEAVEGWHQAVQRARGR